MTMAEELVEELKVHEAFSIPFPVIGKISVPESAVITWVIMAFIMVIVLVFVRDLKLNPNKKQVVIEGLVGFIFNFFEGIFGKAGRRYIPYLGTVLIYLALANLIGLLGIKPPTKDLNVTAGMAVVSILMIEFSGIRAKNPIGYLKSFAHPLPMMIPFNILELGIRPLALAMRLFGNIFGGFVIMELIKMMLSPLLVPVPFSLYFDIFDGLLQAYIFVFLTAMFMHEKMES